MNKIKAIRYQPPYIEDMRAEFVQRRFKEMLGYYGELENMSKKLKVGEYIKANNKNNDWLENTPPARPLALDPSILNKQYLSQDQLRELAGYISEHDFSDESITDRNDVEIYFTGRHHAAPYEALFSHCIVCFTPFGDIQRCITNSEDDLIDAILYAGNGKEIKHAVMKVRLEDGNNYYCELADFSMLALSAENKETGTLTVFNRQLGVLYSEFVNIAPTIEQAVLPLEWPSKTDEIKETQSDAGDENVGKDS